jgi:putative CocE/NonD family hydrolase
MVRIRDQRNHPWFARNGYVSIRVDMRGSGDSEGSMRDMYCSEELDDAIEVIEWIAQQSWCNGRVGMMGTSWGGTSSLQAAARRPESLKAVIAVCATNNRFDDDIHHMGGCLLTDTVEWGATLPAILASPPDPETVGPEWRGIWQKRLAELEFPLENWIRHEWRDQYWRWGSVNETPDAIECPVLMIGGWADRYSNTVMHFLEQSGSKCWGIVGPWGHHFPDQGSPGPAMGFQQESLRWWDHWLKDIDNNIEAEPRLRVWMQEYIKPDNFIEKRPGRWVNESSWPSGNISEQILFLANKKLTPLPPEGGAEVSVSGSLMVGRAAGDTGYFGRQGGLPLDQQADDEHSVVFQGDPLENAIEILGTARLQLELKADHPVSTIVARLNVVHHDGSVARVSYAVRNLALNSRGEKSTDRATGELQRITLEFHHTAFRFEAGQCIRIAISNAYWPIIWPSPHATSTMLSISRMQLVLPIRDSLEDADTTEVAKVADSGTTPTHETISTPPLERYKNVNSEDGVITIGWNQPPCRVYHPNINLEFGFETETRHRIKPADSESAESQCEHTLYFSRDRWQIQVIGRAELRATSTHYHVLGKLTILENGEIVFQKEWQPTIPRTCS